MARELPRLPGPVAPQDDVSIATGDRKRLALGRVRQAQDLIGLLMQNDTGDSRGAPDPKGSSFGDRCQMSSRGGKGNAAEGRPAPAQRNAFARAHVPDTQNAIVSATPKQLTRRREGEVVNDSLMTPEDPVLSGPYVP